MLKTVMQDVVFGLRMLRKNPGFTIVAVLTQRGAIRKLVVGHAVKLAVLGVVIGLAASYGVTRVMRSVLTAVSPTDTMTFIAVAVALTAVAALASYVPARRASRLNPIEALRTE